MNMYIHTSAAYFTKSAILLSFDNAIVTVVFYANPIATFLATSFPTVSAVCTALVPKRPLFPKALYYPLVPCVPLPPGPAAPAEPP